MSGFWSRLLRRPPAAAFVRAYEAAPPPDRRLPWREVPYTVIDVETTGLDARRHALIAIGAVDVEQGRVAVARRWYSLIRPPAGHEPSAANIRIHHLMRADLAAAPPAAEVLPELLAHLAGRALVVHVAAIDVRFINAALRPFGGRLRGPILDTARLAMALHQNAQLLGDVHPGLPAPAIELRGLATAFGLPVYGQHNALNDALTTAQLFLAQATRLAAQGRTNLAGLLREGGA